MAWSVKRADSAVQEDMAVASFPASQAISSDERVRANETHRLLDLTVSIHRALLDKINLSLLDKLQHTHLKTEIGDIVRDLLVDGNHILNSQERSALVDEVLDELLGLGPLEPLLKDETVTDILVNGHKTVFVERYGLLERVSVRFQDE